MAKLKQERLERAVGMLSSWMPSKIALLIRQTPDRDVQKEIRHIEISKSKGLIYPASKYRYVE